MKPRLLATVFMTFLSCGLGARTVVDSLGDIPVSEDHVLRVWELEQGMPDHHVSSTARTADGYLWLTTYSGLLRFDGERFVLMGKSSIPGLPSPWVAPVFAASDRSVWLGLERGGVVRWKDGKIEPVLPIQPRPTPAVWPSRFAEDPAGGIWFTFPHDSRAFRWNHGQVAAFSEPEGIPRGSPLQMEVATNGDVWVGNRTGCYRFAGDRFVEVDPGWGDQPRFAATRNGGMWVARGEQLLRYEKEGRKDVIANLGWLGSNNPIGRMLEDSAGNLWIGSQGAGLFRYRDGQFWKVPTSAGNVGSLAEDKDGNLWAGTWGGGVNRLSKRHFFLKKPAHVPGEANLNAICEDTDGRLWMIAGDGRPTFASDAARTTFEIAAGWDPQVWARVSCPDPKGGVWFGTPKGLFRWENGVFHQRDFNEPVERLFFDRSGVLWIATSNGGVFCLQDDGIKPVPGGEELIQVRAISQDRDGRMWVGTHDGSLFVRKKDEFVRLVLPDAGGDETIRFIVPDKDHTVWIGSLLGGVYRWRDDTILRFPTDMGMPTAEVRSLVIERRKDGHTFWFGTANGLFRASREDIEGVLTGERQSMNVIRHGVNEGLPALDFREGFESTAVTTRDGHLWFATNRGALEVDPSGVRPVSMATRVLIEEAHLGSRLLPFLSDRNWVLPPNPGPFSIRYTLPELGAPEHTRFRYRLMDPQKGEWIPAGAQREVTFARLSPGDYRFEVAAAVGDGPWLPGVAAVDFSVKPAWWQTLGFRMGVVLALVVGVWWVMMLRTRSRIRRLEQERAVERERTRIARDMHDEVGANLTHIAVASRLALLDPHAASGHLGEIASIARQTVDSLDEIVWAVNPRYDTLAGSIEYIGKYAIRFMAGAGISCEVDLPPDLPPVPLAADVRHHLLLVVKEALNNAAKHSGARMVKLKATFEGAGLHVAVEDDGTGFDSRKEPVDSDGLRNMRERMANIHGTLKIESHPGKGTRVVLNLPLAFPKTEARGDCK